MLNMFVNSQFVARIMFSTSKIIKTVYPRMNLNWVWAPRISYRRGEPLLLDRVPAGRSGRG
ncbi:hypothetical protein [Roseovarius sp.]|uniref:hypothetical protein n=1 Tax=Roseovarius sp. TaxID=1486281 RepID=UPI003BA87B97